MKESLYRPATEQVALLLGHQRWAALRNLVIYAAACPYDSSGRGQRLRGAIVIRRVATKETEHVGREESKYVAVAANLRHLPPPHALFTRSVTIFSTTSRSPTTPYS